MLLSQKAGMQPDENYDQKPYISYVLRHALCTQGSDIDPLGNGINQRHLHSPILVSIVPDGSYAKWFLSDYNHGEHQEYAADGYRYDGQREV